MEAATGEREVHGGIGYCIGGTALSLAMGWLAAAPEAGVRTATLFTTLLDFSQPGELGIFIHEPIIAALEAQNEAKGIMDGRQLAVSFSLLRENSLYWNYYIDNYLKGQSPVAFDLLHWNSDSTHVAGKTHSSLLRRLYLENQLVKGGSGSATPASELAKVKTPVLLVSAVDDHIALWQGTWRGMALFGGERRFPPGRVGPYRRHHQPAGGQIRLLAEQDRGRQPRGVAGGRDPQHRLLVAQMIRFIQGRDEGSPSPYACRPKGWRRRQAATSRCGSARCLPAPSGRMQHECTSPRRGPGASDQAVPGEAEVSAFAGLSGTSTPCTWIRPSPPPRRSSVPSSTACCWRASSRGCWASSCRARGEHLPGPEPQFQAAGLRRRRGDGRGGGDRPSQRQAHRHPDHPHLHLSGALAVTGKPWSSCLKLRRQSRHNQPGPCRADYLPRPSPLFFAAIRPQALFLHRLTA